MAFLKSSQLSLGPKTVDAKGFTQAGTLKLGDRAYTEHEVLLADNYNIVGDVTVSDNLILSKLSDDGNAINITGDTTTRTITGSGSIEGATLAQTPNATLTGMTGELGSAVTGGSGLTSIGTTTDGSSLTSLGTVASGTLGSGVTFPTSKFIPLKGITHANGATSGVSGDNTDMLSLPIDLGGYVGYTLYAWAHTTLAENANTANTSRIRIKLYNGSSTVYFAHQRQGIAVYSGIGGDANNSASLSCMGYFTVTSTYATSCTLYMNGGLGGAFSWGAQPAYSSYDNETPNPGGTLGYMLFHP